MEKLELLNSPEERKRRLEEVPIVHADPNMDPTYDNAGEVVEKKQGLFYLFYFLFLVVVYFSFFLFSGKHFFFLMIIVLIFMQVKK